MTQKILFFTGESCAACKAIKPYLDEIEADDIDIIVKPIDAETQWGLTRHYGVRALPTLVAVDDAGQWLDARVGNGSRKEIMDWVAQWRTPA